MNIFMRREREPEESDGETQGTKHGGVESMFWCGFSSDFDGGFFVECCVEEDEDYDGEEDTD